MEISGKKKGYYVLCIFIIFLGSMLESCSNLAIDKRTPGKGESSGDQNPSSFIEQIPSSTPEEQSYDDDNNDDGLRFFSTIQERYEGRFGGNHNKGIVIQGTTLGTKVSVYNGNNCTDETKLLTTVNAIYDKTDVELPNLNEGTYIFSFLETDLQGKVKKCYTSSPVEYKYQRVYNLSSDILILSKSRDEIIRVSNWGYPSKTKRVSRKLTNLPTIHALYFIKDYILVLFSNKTLALWKNIEELVPSDGETDTGGYKVSVDVQSVYITKDTLFYITTNGKLHKRVVEKNIIDKLSSDVEAEQIWDNISGIYTTYDNYVVLEKNGHVSWPGCDESILYGEDKDPTKKTIKNVYTLNDEIIGIRSDGSVVYGGEGEQCELLNKLSAEKVVGVIHSMKWDMFYYIGSDGSVLLQDKYSVSEDLKKTSIPVLRLPAKKVYTLGDSIVAIRPDGSSIDLRHVDGINEKGEIVYTYSYNPEDPIGKEIKECKASVDFNEVEDVQGSFMLLKNGTVVSRWCPKTIIPVGGDNTAIQIINPNYMEPTTYVINSEGSVMSLRANTTPEKLELTNLTDDTLKPIIKIHSVFYQSAAMLNSRAFLNFGLLLYENGEKSYAVINSEAK